MSVYIINACNFGSCLIYSYVGVYIIIIYTPSSAVEVVAAHRRVGSDKQSRTSLMAGVIIIIIVITSLLGGTYVAARVFYDFIFRPQRRERDRLGLYYFSPSLHRPSDATLYPRTST